MNPERGLRLWTLLVEHAAGAPVTLEHVCAVATTVSKVDAAAVAVALSTTPRETLVVSDPLAFDLEELVLTLGEGPGADALAGDPALVSDLTSEACAARWPVFAPAAVAAGVRAVFVLPLQVGGVRLGVMSLYRAKPGDLDRERLADALGLADTACALLLDSVPAGRAHFDGRQPEPVGGQHPEVHQATGMVIAQLGVTAAVALVRLRAYAYAHSRRLRDVAGDVVARRLRLGPDAAGDGHDGGGDHNDRGYGGG